MMRAPAVALLLVATAAPLAAQAKPPLLAPSPVRDSIRSDTVRLDSVRFRATTRGDRVLQGAMAGAVTGALMAGAGAECAPSSSPLQSAAETGLMGALRGLFHHDPVRVHTTARAVALPPRERPPFPFDEQDECWRMRGKSDN